MERFEQYDDNGDPLGNTSAYPSLVGTDAMEAAKMEIFKPRVQGQEDAPWWQGIVKYGLTKAIDNTLPGRSPGIQGNTQPGSFAGQNGQTYLQNGPLGIPPQNASGGGMFGMSMPMVLLLVGGLAVAGFLVLKR